MANIIGRISLQPATVRPGESVCVEVFDTNDQPLAASNTQVWINGVLGARQFLQFPTVGQRRLGVRAQAGDDSDRQVALLTVEGEPLQFRTLGKRVDIPVIGLTQRAAEPYVAILTVGSAANPRLVAPPSIGEPVAPVPIRAADSVTLASRLARRGILARTMASSPQALTRIDGRRLTGLAARPVTLVERVRPTPPVARRHAVTAVYDLSNVDLGQAVAAAAPEAPLEFEWDFGDGTSATTRTPEVRHDYFASIPHEAGGGQFVVTCKIKHADLTVQRSLSVFSAYAICKGTGTVVPHVNADVFAHKEYNMITAKFELHNVENEDMVLNRMSVTVNPEDGDALALPAPLVDLGRPITIAARSSSMVGVNVPFVAGTPAAGQLDHNVKSFSVLYTGTVGTLPVSCRASFDIPVEEWGKPPKRLKLPDAPEQSQPEWPWELVRERFDAIVNGRDAVQPANPAVLDEHTGTLAVSLGPLGAGGRTAGARGAAVQILSAVHAPVARMAEALRMAPVRERPQVAPAAVRNLAAGAMRMPLLARTTGNGIARFGGVGRLGGIGAPLFALEGPPPPGLIAEGQVCDPDNLSEEELAAAEAGQLVCQVTNEVADVLVPARWGAAMKGDVILSPGGDGIIGGLMLNVQPVQWYSHTGIMTRNYREITHCTGSQKRLMDHLVGVLADGSDGFLPSTLKWVWPGAITQSVQDSIYGEDFPDPEYDKTYSVSAFGPHSVGVTHNDQMVMIPPLVLKPNPVLETPAVRAALHAIATDARNDAGRPHVNSKYHYRWYAYTDPTVGLGAPEGADAGWAAGTRGAVCSSYIWMHAKNRGARLESDQPLVTPTDLEPSDVNAGAAVRPTTPDGLYNYSGQERKDAANWLYDTVYNQAYEKAGWLGEILTDGADDIANQFLNVFANDNADGKDSTAWKNVGDADAVSPDNMLFWDGPDRGGLFGFAEPAGYIEPRKESYTVSRWKKVLVRGNVHGKVLNGGRPVAGAQVIAYDGKSAFSGDDGRYLLSDVPLGEYLLKCSRTIDGVLYRAQQKISLGVAEMEADIQLLPPEERYRIAQVFLDFWGRDEETFGDDEIKDPGPEYFELELGPDKLVNFAGRSYHWGGEVRVEYGITVRLLLDNTIDVQLQGTLYEGTSEDTTDLDGQGGTTFLVGVGATTGATVTITNTDEDAGDAGVLSISVKNVRNSA
jgi:hypothetical protein